MAACYGCHRIIDANPVEKLRLFQDRFGVDIMEKMELLSHQTYHGWKKDAKGIAKHYKESFYKLLGSRQQ